MSQQFAAVVVVGLAIFGLALVANEADFDFGDDTGKIDSLTIYERNFGTLGSAEYDNRNVSLGSFTVGEARGEVKALRRNQVDISRGLFSSDTLNFEYNATQPRSGTLSFEVLGKDGTGAVYVDVNGKTVFENALVGGDELTVNIPGSSLNSGVNQIEVGTRKGGIVSSSEYRFEDFQATFNDRKFHDNVESFRIYDYELKNFLAGDLTFQIADAVQTRPLEIRANGEEIYSLSRVRGSERVNITPENSNLGVGFNTLRFSTEGESYYSLENVILNIRFVGRTSRAEAVDEFELNDNELNLATQSNTKETLTFNYRTFTGNPERINVTINGYTRAFTPLVGRNTVEIDEGVLEETNVVRVNGGGSFRLNQLELESERMRES